ncbi:MULTISPECIES: M48 family metallopeptidase [unclassified Spirosoma]|uniref:M48 family metallopeptidase n=1 Tax=unclassified Spirosoma TaxID=2621999 RepID=UPI000962F897|nr:MULTISPECIES: M48 family metallopeptidase [unclassified Spirosoma]MBN8821223.1 M48 family metallopeptidase [Spirosoma sp.]OJW79150.1 MAG: peptidase M48 [Spirosoma sp. 48-14]
MKKVLILMLSLAFGVTACEKVPLTGRKQLILVPPSDMLAMSFTQYKAFLDTSRVVPTSNNDAEMVTRVGNRIRQAVESYMNSNGYSKRLEGFQWEYHLVQSSQVNAWCMPGGKIVVYSGILPYTQNEAGLATVLGHEVSHAIAEHGNERMSEGLVANGLLQAGQVATGIATSARSPQTQALFQQAFGVVGPLAYQFGRGLPHSRNQESEADHLGLIFMSMAGYNPAEAITFWQRMAKASGGKAPAEFFSDHPSDARRIADLQKLLPDAQKYYASARR